jgi:hypothetical protein
MLQHHIVAADCTSLLNRTLIALFISSSSHLTQKHFAWLQYAHEKRISHRRGTSN